ncbi:MAG TPA: hypothetical protein VFJ45_05600 [bacterium]|nr:hypothetical protein [bacterium]
MKLVAVLLVLLAVAPAAQAASTQVSISIPVTQAIEGITTVALTSGAATTQARLVVKSNVPWTLVARVSGTIPGAAFRVGAGAWAPLDTVTPVLRGPRGVHVVTVEVRTQGAAQGLVTLSLASAPGGTP